MTAARPSGPSIGKLLGRAFTLWIGAGLLVVGLVFATVGARQTLLERTYRDEGQTANAVVLDKWIVRAEREGNRATRYVLSYRYTTAEGEAIEDSADVSVEEWERVEPGATFPIAYLPGQLDASRASTAGDWIAPLVFLVIGGVFTLMGTVLAFTSARSVARVVKVCRVGKDTEGTVVRAGPTNVVINRVPQWRLHYRYRDELGRNREGSSHLVSPHEGSAWREGDHGIVRFDRERPQRSVWIGKS